MAPQAQPLPPLGKCKASNAPTPALPGGRPGKGRAGRCLQLFLSHRQSQDHGPERDRERERDRINSLLLQIIGHSKQALPGPGAPAQRLTPAPADPGGREEKGAWPRRGRGSRRAGGRRAGLSNSATWFELVGPLLCFQLLACVPAEMSLRVSV